MTPTLVLCAAGRVFGLSVVAAVALLPAVGPLLDHHYAGRQLGHGHLYLGAVLYDHVHGHEVIHTHSDGGVHIHTDDDGHDGHDGHDGQSHGAPSGVVFFASHSGAVHGHAYVPASALSVDLSFPEPAESLSMLLPREGALSQQNFVTPPTQPPRA